MLRAATAILLAATAAPPAMGAPAPRPDRDAMREVRRGAADRFASARAISHYLEARDRHRAGDGAGRVEHLRLAVAYDEGAPELRVALALALAETGAIEHSEGEARRALQLGASGAVASEAHVLLGQIAAARDQPQHAISAFRSAIRIEAALAAGGERPDPEPWRILALLHLERGDEGAAVKVLEDLASHAPGDGSGFRELGRALLARREPARAEGHLRRAAEIDRRDLEALRLLAHAHESLRREADAREDLLGILRVSPGDVGALLALGRMAVRQGDVPGAREWFHRLVQASPDRTDAHVQVALQWLEGGEGAEALAVARAGIAELGAEARLRFAEGLALQELRRWSEAAQALSAVRTESGEVFPSARIALADALSRAGRHAEAERALEALLAAHPEDARLVSMRAVVLERAGRSPDAIALLRRTIQERERSASEGEVVSLHVSLAERLVRSGRAEDAVSSLRGALSSRPRNEDLLYALGAAYDRAGHSETAAAQMRALLAVSPEHAEAMNFLGYSYALQGVRLDEAERLVRRALELKPRSGHVLDSLGWILFRRGDHRGAIEALEQAESLAGPDATIQEHLGDAYVAGSRLLEAAQAYRRALASVDEEPALERARRRAAIEKKLTDLTPLAGRGAAR